MSLNGTAPINPGDPVLIDSGGREVKVPKIGIVARVTARKIVLEDGTEWTRFGQPWGTSSGSGWDLRPSLKEASPANFKQRTDLIARLNRERRNLGTVILERLPKLTISRLARILEDTGLTRAEVDEIRKR